MALLLGSIDPDKIRIMGRWCSNSMFRYLHVHALPLINHKSTIMFCGRNYTLAYSPLFYLPIPPYSVCLVFYFEIILSTHTGGFRYGVGYLTETVNFSTTTLQTQLS